MIHNHDVPVTDTVRPPLIEAAARLRMAVVPLARHLRRHTDDAFTPTQLSVMGAIVRHGPLSLGDLATRERLSLPSISTVVDALEAAGLVGRRADVRDRRVCLVESTKAGSRWAEATRTRRNAWLAERLGTLSAEERKVLATAVPLLERLIDDR